MIHLLDHETLLKRLVLWDTARDKALAWTKLTVSMDDLVDNLTLLVTFDVV